jgi:hypothetical protein
MKGKSKKGVNISRRNILPILGSGLLIPFLGFGNTEVPQQNDPEDNEEYQTLLKADGTTVKIKVSALKRSKIVKKNITNKSFLKWLGK